MVPAWSAAAMRSSLLAVGAIGWLSGGGEVAPAGVSSVVFGGSAAGGELAPSFSSFVTLGLPVSAGELVFASGKDAAEEAGTEPVVREARRETVRMKLPNRRDAVMRWLRSNGKREAVTVGDSREGQR